MSDINLLLLLRPVDLYLFLSECCELFLATLHMGVDRLARNSQGTHEG